VVALAGISEEDLARYRSPATFDAPAEPLPNPPIDSAKPHLEYPEAVYRTLMAMPDDEVTRRFSESEPPVS